MKTICRTCRQSKPTGKIVSIIEDQDGNEVFRGDPDEAQRKMQNGGPDNAIWICKTMEAIS